MSLRAATEFPGHFKEIASPVGFVMTKKEYL